MKARVIIFVFLQEEESQALGALRCFLSCYMIANFFFEIGNLLGVVGHFHQLRHDLVLETIAFLTTLNFVIDGQVLFEVGNSQQLEVRN